MSILAGKVAVVTGASRGIGRAIALRLARGGAAVVVNYSTPGADADGVVQAIEHGGGVAAAIGADVSDRAAIRELFERAEARFGGVDIVVNNAGVLKVGTVAEVTEQDFDQVFGVNARGAFFVLQESARRVRDGGRIISTSSSVTRQPLPHTAVYAASKAAVEIFTRVLARELGSRGITVNAVAPGGTATQMLSAARVRDLASETAFGRAGKPEDIADAVAMLAGPDSHWITGQTIHVSGGQV
jgi:3-oxoacyl-[acyl-carrier protein] reductase